MKKLILILAIISLIALYFANSTAATHTVDYSALKGGKLGALQIEIDGTVQKVTGGDIQKLYWSADEGIESISIKENKYLFHTHYAVENVKYVETVSYTYTINSIENGIYEGSATDNTGVIFDDTVIPAGLEINRNDIVQITFPVDDHETFLSFKKLN
jgi:hypothetical protein